MMQQIPDEKQVFNDLIRQTQVSAKVSRLIAQENITIQYSNDAKAASFDIVRRVLTYPYSLVFDDEDVHDTLMFHEIGHARYTKNYMAMRERNVEDTFDYWNVVEDIRIERFMKRDYPGSVRVFERGWGTLFYKNWFGTQRKIEVSTFANRLNVYAKCGVITAGFIKFSKTEMNFVHRCQAAETEEDVHALAVELAAMAGFDRERTRQMILDQRREYELMRKKWRAFYNERELLDLGLDEVLEEDEDFPEEDDTPVGRNNTSPSVATDDEDEGRRKTIGGGGGSLTAGQGLYGDENITKKDSGVDEEEVTLTDAEKKLMEEALELDTEKEFQKSFESSKVLGSGLYVYKSIEKRLINIPSARSMHNAVVAMCHGNIRQRNAVVWAGENDRLDYMNKMSIDTRRDIQKSVDYMARQFDAKKAALRAKFAVVSNSGQLNVNRAYAFKYSDDVFLKRTKLADAKNHGVVIMLDASGSIDKMWGDMVRQVLIITEFCRKVQIPFKVYIFGASLNVHPDVKTPVAVAEDDPARSHPFLKCKIGGDTIAEVLSSELSTPEYRTMVGALLLQEFFRFGGTPTTEAILSIEHDMNEFFSKNGVQVRKLFVVTDGGAADGDRELTNYLSYGLTRCFVSDPLTRKNYYVALKGEHYDQTTVDLVAKIYKDRYSIDTIHIALGHEKQVFGYRYSRKAKKKFFDSSSMAPSFGFDRDNFDAEELHRAYEKNNFLLKTTPLGIPVFFVKPVVPETALEIDFNDPKVNTFKKYRINQISKAFTEGLKSIKTSQTFMSILMTHISAEIV